MMKYLLVEDHKDRFRGKRAFIIASGPSVASLDLSFLRNEIVYLVNGATLLQEKFDLKPAYFCTTDARFLKADRVHGLASERLHSGTIRLIRDIVKPFDRSSLASRTIYARTIAKNGFSQDMKSGFYFWCTSVSLAMQMAWYNGVNELYLLGVDLNYKHSAARFYQEERAQPVDPFLGVQLHNIVQASRYFEANDRKVYLCSKESLLKPYISVKNFEMLF